ncbi:hypothetical protein DHD05_10550 [Arenibacter sp. N53]|nr:hypothetical protein [Arenibacter sp. N53]
MNLYIFLGLAIVTFFLGFYNLVKRSRDIDFSFRPIESVYYHSWAYIIVPLITIGGLYSYVPEKGPISNTIILLLFLAILPILLDALLFYFPILPRFIMKIIRMTGQSLGFFLALSVITYATLDMNHPYKKIDDYQIGIEGIQESAYKINENISSLDSVISIETSNINSTFDVLMEQIKNKNEELKKIESERAGYIEQIDFYKNLSNLSKEEATAVIKQFDKSSNGYSFINLLASFFLGALASAFGNYISSMISKKAGKKKPESSDS